MGTTLDRSQRFVERAAVEMDVLVALLDLGSTGDEIARTLKERGIAGRPRSPQGCPIAHYLGLHLGLQTRVFGGHVMACSTMTLGQNGQ